MTTRTKWMAAILAASMMVLALAGCGAVQPRDPADSKPILDPIAEQLLYSGSRSAAMVSCKQWLRDAIKEGEAIRLSAAFGDLDVAIRDTTPANMVEVLDNLPPDVKPLSTLLLGMSYLAVRAAAAKYEVTDDRLLGIVRRVLADVVGGCGEGLATGGTAAVGMASAAVATAPTEME